LIQPFQQPERVIGFFNTYRHVYPVSRDVLREIAQQFQNWVVNRSQKWDAPILEEPEERTATCCRRARISRARSARERTKARNAARSEGAKSITKQPL
jgi:hypothetical protein